MRRSGTQRQIGTRVRPVTPAAAPFLAVVLLAAALAAGAQREIPHTDARTGERFEVGMFAAGTYTPDHEYLDYAASRTAARLDSIWRGYPGGYEACNVVHFYHDWWHRDGADDVIENILEPLSRYNAAHPGADLRVVIGTLYTMFVSAKADEDAPLHFIEPDGSRSRYQWMDHHLTPTLREQLTEYVRTLALWERRNAPGIIAGWLAFEEPILHGQDLAEYYRLVDAVKAAEAAAGVRHHPIYGVLHPAGFIRDVPEDRAGRWINYDGRIFTKNTGDFPTPGTGGAPIGERTGRIGDIIEGRRFPSPGGRYDGTWYYTMWEADVVLLEFYGPPHTWVGRNWGTWISGARADIAERGDRRSWEGDWEVHPILPGLMGYHVEYSREARRRVTADGIWFYAWNHPCGGESNRCEGTARHYWREPGLAWARAVEEELEGSDQLIVSRSLGIPGNAPAGGTTEAAAPRHVVDRHEIDGGARILEGDFGPAAAVLSSEDDACRVTAMTAGDFDGDGDDELVIAFSDPSLTANPVYFWEDPEPGVVPGAGACSDGVRLVTVREYHVTALASGDFDGDADDELVIATSRSERHTDNRVDVYEYFSGWTGSGSLGDPLTIHRGKTAAGYATAMAAGDFDGDGTDELMVALSNHGLDSNEIRFVDGITREASPPPTIRTHPPVYESSSYHVAAMTAADYDGDTRDDLVVGWSGASAEPAGAVSRFGRYAFSEPALEGLRNGSLGRPHELGVDPASHFRATAMASGDFDGDGDDETLVALHNENLNENAMYFVEDAASGSPWISIVVPPEYASHTVTAIAGGDFTSSDLKE